ncbi:MAG: cation diffusion facilitator family transporter [Thermoplasmata archaeon]|nr:cation diffusion facilitator family transporter [Thermoplasmata archaeon]
MANAADENFEFQKIVVVLGFTLLIIKYVAYWLTGSVAIFTDATESIVNVVAACVGIYALYLSAQPADRDHPFGHGKVEIISSAIEGSMIIVAGAVIIYETIESFIHPGDITDKLDIGLVLIALAAVANYVVGRAAIRRGNKTRSPALVASGKHLCSDTYSSIGILIGLVVVFIAESMGYDATWLDSSIAAIFGIIIIGTGIGVMKRAVDEVMDTADDDLLDEVTETINEYRHDDWIDVYNLRLIKYGPKIYANVKVVYPRTMTVEQQAQENDEIDEAIRAKYGDAVETSINSVPCQPFHCRYCGRNCLARSQEFEGQMVWTADILCTKETHAPRPYVTVESGDQSL